jgi:hypothetical protein
VSYLGFDFDFGFGSDFGDCDSAHKRSAAVNVAVASGRGVSE